jgi:hypothetical protein
MARRTRGTGEVYRESGRLWAFRWRENGKRRYSGGHPSKQIAERALAQVKAQVALERAHLPFDPKGVPRLSVLADGFLERRKATHEAWAEDGYRWRKHIAPHFGHLRPDEVDRARIRSFIEVNRTELAPRTIRVCVALLSSLFADLMERKLAAENPARGLPRSVMRLMLSDHDPRTTPFVDKLADIRRIFPKLFPILTAWKLRHGGEGRVIPPLRCDGAKVDDKHTPGKRLRTALKELGLARPGFGLPSAQGAKESPQKLWYWCTRHTFASHWVMAGGSIEKLSTILGHSSVEITWRHYVHLRPELFSDSDHRTISLDRAPGEQQLLALPGNGQPSAS